VGFPKALIRKRKAPSRGELLHLEQVIKEFTPYNTGASCRYVTPKGDVERARTFSVFVRGGTQRSNRPSQIELSCFSLRFSSDLESGNVSRVPPAGGEDLNPRSVRAGFLPLATPWSETRCRKVGWRSRILVALGSRVSGTSDYLSRESTKLYGGQGPLKSSLTDSLGWR
jgi:hypothetical protein